MTDRQADGGRRAASLGRADCCKSGNVSDDITFYDEIEGYCGRLSYRAGATATVHVSTPHRYDVVVERWGARREVLWEATGVDGVSVPAPVDADSVGCAWPASVHIPIGDDWRSGFHLVTLTAHGAAAGRDVAHACFVVTAPSTPTTRSCRALFVLGTNTWNAYNTWGGASLYTGGTQVSFRRPFGRGMLCRPEVDRDDRKARPARWGEEPDVNGDHFQEYRFTHGYPASIGSSGWFTHERRFVEWAESEGYEFDSCISTDLDDDPTIADGYDLLIDVGHDEYWSCGARQVVESHVQRGGHLASFSGNTMFWQIRIEHDGDVMVCHKYAAHISDPMLDVDPARMSGMWADPIVNEPEWSLLGAGSRWGLYNRFGQATPRGSGAYTVYRDDHWMLANTGLRYGDLLGAKHGVVGYETVGCPIDLDEFQLPIARAVPGAPQIERTEIVALTPSSNIGVGEYPASISALSDQGDLEFTASRFYGRVDADSLARCRYGNSVMLVTRPYADGVNRQDGEVMVVGTTDWVFGLADDPAVAQVTRNILNRHLTESPVGSGPM